LATKKLRLASNAKTRSSLGVLERKFGKANRKARKRLVASTGLGHNSELSSRTVSIREATLRPVTSEVSYDPVEAAAA